MSNVLMGVIGVVLFIGLALAGALFLGDRFLESKDDAEAARYITEGAQIAHAYELYGLQEGKYPDGETSDEKMEQMKDAGYLTSTPLGGQAVSGYTTSWYIDETKGAALTFIGENETSKNICVKARIQAGLPDPENVKQCDAPDIANNDPCCIGA